MSVLLALGSAIAYGTSDFIGGLVSRRASAWAVAVVVQLASALSLAVVAAFAEGSPTSADFAWTALAGVGSGAGVGFLFRGLANGQMSVVAPLSAVGAALVPVTVGLVSGERPGPWTSLGIAAALPGIWLVAAGEKAPVLAAPRPGAPGAVRSGVIDGLLAGLGFGFMFTALGQVSPEAGLWPLTLCQAVSAAAAAGLATLLGGPWRPDRSSWRALPAGPLGALAVLCFQLAIQDGLLSVSSVLAALYPAATILLAMLLLRERVKPSQAVGLVLCGLTVGLVALG